MKKDSMNKEERIRRINRTIVALGVIAALFVVFGVIITIASDKGLRGFNTLPLIIAVSLVPQMKAYNKIKKKLLAEGEDVEGESVVDSD